jgi:hypothetical protein
MVVFCHVSAPTLWVNPDLEEQIEGLVFKVKDGIPVRLGGDVGGQDWGRPTVTVTKTPPDGLDSSLIPSTFLSS